MKRVILLVPLVAGCGDPLFGGPSLDGLLGVQPPPQQPAWEFRWYQEDFGMVVDCDLIPASEVGSEDALFGELRLTPPDPQDPPVWAKSDTVAVGIAVLVDEATYRPFVGYPPPDDVDEEDFDDEEDFELTIEERFGDALASDFERGVWGVSLEHAVVVVRPGGESLTNELIVGADDLVFEPETQWLGMVAELTYLSDSFDDTLYLPPERVENVGLWVNALEFTEPELIPVYTGEPLGGVHPGASCE